MGIKYWNLLPHDASLAEALGKQMNMPPVVADILVTRGYNTKEKILAFLDEKGSFHDPFLMKDMEKAVERITRAIEEGERVCVYGDYDCDGITSIAMVYSYLETVGADVCYYIPDREKEGYGLNCKAIESLAKQDVSLIITVDNGTTALEEVAFAKEQGIDTVITDHHTPRLELPHAVAIVNPHQKDCPYPFKNLCGAGIAFKLICAMEGDRIGEEVFYAYGALATIGTVADIVELTGENRAIVRQGLPLLQESDRPGIAALIEVCGLGGKTLTASSVAFGLVPRINAAGRLGETQEALSLLLTEDDEEAQELAKKVDSLNIKRKAIEGDIGKDIVNQIQLDPTMAHQRVIVAAGEGWHHGVIGIVASKVVAKFSKPCILIGIEGDEARASGRSVEGYSLIDAISRSSSCLTRYGGHAQAAGLSLKPRDIPKFSSELWADSKLYFDNMPMHAQKIDCMITPSFLSIQNVQALSMLEPFGCGNEQPVFGIEKLTVESIYPIGNNKHIKLLLSGGGKQFYGLYFGMTAQQFPYKIGDKVDIAVTLSINEYAGQKSVSAMIQSMRPWGFDQEAFCESKQLYDKYIRKEPIPKEKEAAVTPTREDAAAVYRYLKTEEPFCSDYDILYSRLQTLGYCKIRLILNILGELSLLEILEENGQVKIKLLPTKQKVDIESSCILQRLRDGVKNGIYI